MRCSGSRPSVERVRHASEASSDSSASQGAASLSGRRVTVWSSPHDSRQVPLSGCQTKDAAPWPRLGRVRSTDRPWLNRRAVPSAVWMRNGPSQARVAAMERRDTASSRMVLRVACRSGIRNSAPSCSGPVSAMKSVASLTRQGSGACSGLVPSTMPKPSRGAQPAKSRVASARAMENRARGMRGSCSKVGNTLS